MDHKDGKIKNDVNHRKGARWMKWRSTSMVFCDCRITIKLKGIFYKIAIIPTILDASKCWAVKKHAHKMSVVEMEMLR